MRQLILHMITSLDGFISTPDGAVNDEAQWDEEMQRFYLGLFTACGGAIFGRNLHEEYVGHWSKVAAGQVPATSDLELRWTRRLMSMHRYVVSNSLSHTVDGVRVISGDIAAEIKQIKEQDGGDLLLMCGPALFAELTRQQLIDQYMLYVCPNAIGQGNHLFRDISGPVKLAFDHTVPFSTGVNLHYYRPVSISA